MFSYLPEIIIYLPRRHKKTGTKAGVQIKKNPH